MEPPGILTADEVADYLKIPKSTVYKLSQEGRLPCQKIGRHWRFLKSAIDEWLENSHGMANAGRHKDPSRSDN